MSSASSRIIQPDYFLPLRWTGSSLLILDQRLLPQQEQYVEAHTPEQVAEAITSMQVRGAPAIGIAAAFGVVLAARNASGCLDKKNVITQACSLLAATRPTARNLFWALERMGQCAESTSGDTLIPTLEQEALAIQREDYESCRRIGTFGADLVPEDASILTHCNAGALATAGWGTALGIIRSAREQGKTLTVFADETRPLLQGSRLTAWELARDGIIVTILPDNAAGYCMRKELIDLVIVGADRIARNGDVVNKIGTYQVALMAYEHDIPFYVAAPLSTFDTSLSCGEEIPIEERSQSEVLEIAGYPADTVGIPAFNPAFDITPASLVSAIVCENGILYPPYTEAIEAAVNPKS